MKTTSKRLITLLLALLMAVSVFAGCSGTATPSATPTQKTTATPTPAGTTDKDEPDDNPSGLPLVNEPTTVTVWQAFTSTVIGSMNESYFVDYLEEATGVRLKFTNVSTADAVTLFNLMIASEDYCDIIREGGTPYQGGGDKAIEDGVYLKLNDLIEEFAPNYSAIRAKGGEYEKTTITDKGNIWSMYGIKDPAEYAWCGMGLRKDILDKYSVALPVTIADWDTCLQTFKDDGVKAPLLLDQTGVFYNSEFLSAYGVGREFYQVNGKVMYGFVQPEFKEYLTQMNDWYERGLIDQDFAGRGITMVVAGGNGDPAAMMNRGEAAAVLTTWGYSANRRFQTGQSEIKDIWISAVQAPKLNTNDTVHFKFPSWVAANANAITTSCKNPELVVRLLDYLYSPEGSIMLNYGKEDLSYTMVDGQPRYTDIILKDADGNVPRDVSVKYVWDDGIGLIDFKRLWQAFEEESMDALAAYETWNSDSMANVLPVITMTQEEGSEHSAIMGDIKTFVNENVTQFITGAKPLSGFDAFVQQINSMKIDRATEIYQTALDRYNAR